MLAGKLTKSLDLNCTILEVKVIEGFGTTIDVILVDGVLREGDTIVVCGMQNAIVTNIRALLTPHPGKELRVKGQYVHHKKVCIDCHCLLFVCLFVCLMFVVVDSWCNGCQDCRSRA
jgi:translation initiation factor IF-2